MVLAATIPGVSRATRRLLPAEQPRQTSVRIADHPLGGR
jgi:hypothetical protein